MVVQAATTAETARQPRLGTSSRPMPPAKADAREVDDDDGQNEPGEAAHEAQPDEAGR